MSPQSTASFALRRAALTGAIGLAAAAALLPARAEAADLVDGSAPQSVLPGAVAESPAPTGPVGAPQGPVDPSPLAGASTAQGSGDSLTPLSYAVDGAAEVRTGIRGVVTIAGTFSGAYDPADGSITGGFALTPTRAHVTALGFLPVIAETDWIFTEPVRGSWQDGVLRLRIAAKIRHPRMWAFGVPVAGGPQCATREPSVIELAGPADPAAAAPPAGGTLTTSEPGFSISALTGCGPLNGFLSAVAAGGGNRASIAFTAQAGG